MLYLNYIKPIIDYIFAFLGFIILLPVFSVIYIILLFLNQGKPFFCHFRAGKNGKVFKIIKFKTMKDLMVEDKDSISDYDRITNFGYFLRKYSLDEIPQLINVLKGEMSLIGPRPLLVKYLSYYNSIQNQRHAVKPGITGWAQINGRNSINWKTKFELDVWYVKNISFKLDVKIFFMTLYKVLKKDKIYNEYQTVNDEFNGTN